MNAHYVYALNVYVHFFMFGCPGPAAVTYADLGGVEAVLGSIRELIEYPLRHPEVTLSLCWILVLQNLQLKHTLIT
jgi:hypothetical protein